MFRSLLAFLFLLSVSASDGRERILHDHDHKGGIHCLKPMEHELTFNNLAQALFVEHLMPPGDILDIGAEFGEWSCMYACFGHHSNRSVIAVEPSIREFERMVKCNYPNIKKFNKGMGAVHSRIQFDADRIGMVQELSLYYNSNGNVEITTVDDFFMKELQSFPGFMHIDVEGNELDLLKGAQQIIKNYSPIIAFEVHLLYNETFTKEILTYTAQMGGGYEVSTLSPLLFFSLTSTVVCSDGTNLFSLADICIFSCT